MAADNHVHYARIGFTLLIGCLAILATLVYLGGWKGEEDLIWIESYCDKPVDGLSVGSAVNFRGVKIGEVREISFVGMHYEVPPEQGRNIYVLMAVERKKMRPDSVRTSEDAERFIEKTVSKGLRAVVTASGITGLSRIECDFVPDAEVAVAPTWKTRHAWVPMRHSLMDNFSDAATKVMNQINAMDISSVFSNLASTVKSMAAMSADLRNSIERSSPDVARIVEEAQDAASSLRAFAETIKNDPSTLLRGQKPEALPETAE